MSTHQEPHHHTPRLENTSRSPNHPYGTDNPDIEAAPYPIPGDLIDGTYRVLEEIGCGGVAIVFKAVEEPSGRHVALKMLQPHALSNPALSRRFEREAEITQFVAQRNIIRVYGSGTHRAHTGAASQPYMVMELLRGQSLDAYISERGPLSVRECLSLLLPVLDALARTHSLGVIHRDLKPGNVFCSQPTDSNEVTIKLLDYGLAKDMYSGVTVASEEELTLTGVAQGTPAYMAPEQCYGLSEANPASDIYSVGCIVYEMLTGRPPFMQSSLAALFCAHLSHPVPPLPAPLTGHPIEGFLHKALAKKPRDRFCDVIDMLQAAIELQHLPDAGLDLRAPRERPSEPQGGVGEADTLEVVSDHLDRSRRRRFTNVKGGFPAPIPWALAVCSVFSVLVLLLVGML